MRKGGLEPPRVFSPQDPEVCPDRGVTLRQVRPLPEYGTFRVFDAPHIGSYGLTLDTFWTPSLSVG